MIEADIFKNAMRNMATGVSVLTTDGPAGRRGVTVSAVCSLSAEPPSLLACVHHLSQFAQAVTDNGAFCVNVLAEDQWRIADCFAGRIPELREDKFAGASWAIRSSGCPVLVGAAASFDCRLERVESYATHRLVMGSVQDAATREVLPLIYADQDYRLLRGTTLAS